MANWRADPLWSLVSYDSTYYKSQPEKPPAAAELAGDGAWASVYHEHRCVATWFRALPMDKNERRRLSEQALERSSRRR